MYQNNQQQTPPPPPFAVDRPTSNVLQIDFNRPPFVPPNIQCVQWLNPYINLLTGCLMDRIQNAMGQGAVSMHFFNWMSANGWANSDFVAMVQDAADFIFIENQQYVPNPNDLVNGIIPRMAEAFVTMRSLYSVKQFPALWQFIAPQDQNAVNQEHYTFEGFMGRIMNMRRDSAAQNVGQPVGYAQGGQTQRHQPYTTSGAAYQGGAPTSYATGGVDARRGGGRDFAVPASAAAATNSMTPPFNPAVKEQVMQQQQAQQPVQADPDNTPWRAPAEPAYPPAYNPTKSKLIYVIKNGATHPALKELAPMIEFDRHNLATLFGRPPAGSQVLLDNAMSEQNLVKAVASRDVEADGADHDVDSKHITKKALVCELSLDQAILSGRADWMLFDTPPKVYHVFADVYLPILSGKDETDTIINFGKSSSYIELREKIKAAGEESSLELLHEVNVRMTQHVNYMLHKRLSIIPADLGITDFVEDLDDLLGVLRKNPIYGERIEKAFLQDQKKEIAALFKTIDRNDDTGDMRELYEVNTANVLGPLWEERETRPDVNYLGQMYQLTFIDVNSHDLQVAGVADVGNALVADFQPFLSSLAEQIFENESSPSPIAHRLVITKDGRILELTKGNLANGFHLIHLVK